MKPLLSPANKLTIISFIRKSDGSPGPEPGPVLLCPYVMDSQPLPVLAAGPFIPFSYADGVATGTVAAEAGTGSYASFADPDYDTLNSPTTGESMWQTIAPGNGTIAFEAELVQQSDAFFDFQVSINTGNIFDNDYALGNVVARESGVVYEVSGTGSRFLIPSDTYPEYPYGLSIGDRVGVVIDTDTGRVDLVSSHGHENFGAVPIMDVSDGAGFGFACNHDSAGATDSVVKAYTKATDMQLPYPAGTTDSCLTGGLRELVAYPLDASEAELAALGFAGKPDMSLAQQRADITFFDNAGAQYNWGAATEGVSTGTPNMVVWSGGKCFEYEIMLPDLTESVVDNDQVASLSASWFTTAFSNVLNLTVFSLDDGTHDLSINDHAGATVHSENLPAGTYRVGFRAEDSAGYRVWIESTEIPVTPNSLNVEDSSFVLSMSQLANMESDSYGKKVRVRLITDPYWFTTPFPAGSRDINGNVFN